MSTQAVGQAYGEQGYIQSLVRKLLKSCEQVWSCKQRSQHQNGEQVAGGPEYFCDPGFDTVFLLRFCFNDFKKSESFLVSLFPHAVSLASYTHVNMCVSSIYAVYVPLVYEQFIYCHTHRQFSMETYYYNGVHGNENHPNLYSRLPHLSAG